MLTASKLPSHITRVSCGLQVTCESLFCIGSDMKTNKIKLPASLGAFLNENSDTAVKERKIKGNYFYSVDDSVLDKHQTLAKILSEAIPKNSASKGFSADCSYLDFLKPHTPSRFFLRMDISSFFHSIPVEQIANKLKPYFDNNADNESHAVSVDSILKKVTYKVPETSSNKKILGETILPMGFPCSPTLSNLFFRPLDIVIQSYCLEHDVIYTRYADDMLFSSKYNQTIGSGDLETFIKRLMNKNSLLINTKKTLYTEGHISLNGYVIDSNGGYIRLSNSKLLTINKLTKMLIVQKVSLRHVAESLFGMNIRNLPYENANTNAFFEKKCRKIVLDKVRGFRSHIIGVKKHGVATSSISAESVKKYEKIIGRLEKIILQHG